MTARLYCPQALATGALIEVPSAAAHHAVRVLRLRIGDPLTLFNGEGGEFSAEVTTIEPRRVVARIRQMRAIERESPLQVTLIQGLAGSELMDYAIEKSVELGVTAIAPVSTSRSVARLDAARAAKRATHWQAIIVAACEQCGRNRLPVLHPLIRLADCLDAASIAQSARRLLLLPDAASSLADVDRPTGAIELLVGPEGGLAADESAAALRAGFHAVRLGPRILRTETAAPAALAAMNALWGDWR